MSTEASYAQQLADRELELIAAGGPDGERLVRIAERIAELRCELAEFDATTDAGRYATLTVRTALEHLDSAGSWSTWDVLGGGLFSDAMKHGQIDRANAFLGEASEALRTFGERARALGVRLSVDLRPALVDRTFDVWFDNVFSDLHAREHIGRAKREAARVLELVEHALAEVGAQRSTQGSQYVELCRVREQLLTAA